MTEPEPAEQDPDERRAMVRAARIATGRSAPAALRDEPAPASPPGTIWDQAARAAVGWMYLTPYLLVSPFLWNPPLWIAALTQLPDANPPDDPHR